MKQTNGGKTRGTLLTSRLYRESDQKIRKSIITLEIQPNGTNILLTGMPKKDIRIKIRRKL